MTAVCITDQANRYNTGMPALEMRLLGPFQVKINHNSVDGFRSDKVRALLAYLAVEAGRPHRREALAALLWPEWNDQEALNNLRKSLHRLRQALDEGTPGLSEGLLSISRQDISLNASDVWLDVHVFRARLGEIEAHAHRSLAHCPGCLEKLTQAIDLYQTELLQGFSLKDAYAFDEWLAIEREALRFQALASLYALSEAYEQRGSYPQAAQYAARQLAIDPWNEEAQRQLMRALALDGKRSQALAQFEICKRTLAEQLGVEPSNETLALHKQILEDRLSAEISATQAIELRHFPTQFTRFVGRRTELEQIVEHLAQPECRLLSIVGPGGMGKTRLSIQAAQAVRAAHLDFPDGLYFVPLAGVTGANLLPSALAHSLGLTLYGSAAPQEQVIDFLRHKCLLLVLDNFEHLLEGAELVNSILQAAPDVKLLVTTQQALRLRAEWRLALEGLDYPAEDAPPDIPPLEYSAVQLFAQAAAQQRIGFKPDSRQQTSIARICRLLWGIPLAIEIAAAWIETYDAETIAAQLAHDLDFLTSPLSDMPERHRSLRAVFEHAWARLSVLEQEALARLSVFRGGFTQEAALVITQAEQCILDELAQKSLRMRPGGMRWEMHELLRRFAAEKLAVQSESENLASQAHSAYYLEWIARQTPEFYGPQPQQARDAIQNELDNERRAWDWAAAHGCAEALEAALDGLHRFHLIQGLYNEGLAAMQSGIDGLPPGESDLLSGMFACQAEFLHLLGKPQPAQKAAEQALALAQHSRSTDKEAEALLILSEVNMLQGSYELAQTHVEQAHDLSRKSSQKRNLARALNQRGTLHYRRSEYPLAAEYARQALEIDRQAGNRLGETSHLMLMGMVGERTGEYEMSLACYQQALEFAQALENRPNIASALNNIGIIQWRRNDFIEALKWMEQSLQIERQLGHRLRSAKVIGNIGIVYDEQGQFNQAIECYQQALHIYQEIGDKEAITKQMGNLGIAYSLKGEHERAMDYLQQALGLCRDLGYRSGEALWLGNLGEMHRRQGQYKQALAYYEQAIPMHRELNTRGNLAETLHGKASILRKQGDYAGAQAANDEALHVAEQIGYRILIFSAGMQKEHIAYAQAALAQDAAGQAKAAAALRAMLAASAAAEEQAALHQTLWEISGDKAHARAALKLYRQLYTEKPDAEYLKHIHELEGKRA